MSVRAFIAATDALTASLSMGLGATVLLFSMVAPQYLGAGVLAMVLSVAITHLLTARAQRPVFYGARFFESATLAAMVISTAQLLPDQGIDNNAQTRLTILVSIGAMAALVAGGLWAIRAQRFTRFIPAPVYVGFANTITVVIVVAHGSLIWRQSAVQAMPYLAGGVAALAFATAMVTRHFRPKWPAGGLGLLAGLLLGWGLDVRGTHLPTVLQYGQWTLPVLEADFQSFFNMPASFAATAGIMVVNALMLGVLMFLNTVVTGQMLTQFDDREQDGQQDHRRQTLGMVLAGASGSAPISGAPTCSFAALRHGPIRPESLVFLAGLALLVLFSQALTYLPLIAVSGAMLFDAWVMWNRDSVHVALNWLRRRPTPRHVKEDTVLILSVMLTSVSINQMAGLVTGLSLGLLLHTLRSSQQPIRHIWSGHDLSSNCVRGPAELSLLQAHGGAICIFQLNSQQFFATADILNQTARQKSEAAHYVVFDWSLVERIDTSVAMAMERLEKYFKSRRVLVWHAGAHRHRQEVFGILRHHLSEPNWSKDLDRALEDAEYHLIEHFSPPRDSRSEDVNEPPWLAQLSGPQRALLDRYTQEVHFAGGQVIVRAGEPGRDMWLILTGYCDVYVHYRSDNEMRIAGVAPGTMVGEMGFFENASRSATVVAADYVRALRIDQACLNALREHAPQVLEQMLLQLTRDLSARLRFLSSRKKTG